MIFWPLLGTLAAVWALSGVPRRQAPYVTCECGRRWRSWDPNRLCHACRREGAKAHGLAGKGRGGQLDVLPDDFLGGPA